MFVLGSPELHWSTPQALVQPAKRDPYLTVII
nr:MAG TPA: hypothetical protein [Caudoviricetes sp.]